MKTLFLTLSILGLLCSPGLSQSIVIHNPDGSTSYGQQAGNAFSVMSESGAYTSGYRDAYGNITVYQFEGLDRKGQSAPRFVFEDDDSGGGGED